jgi:DNA-binding transcriptional LysR family regulator
MEVFARVFELGGFSAAARALRLTPSAISKLVGRLEARLGARLVNRSTRGLQFTPEGRLFYDRAYGCSPTSTRSSDPLPKPRSRAEKSG